MALARLNRRARTAARVGHHRRQVERDRHRAHLVVDEQERQAVHEGPELQAALEDGRVIGRRAVAMRDMPQQNAEGLPAVLLQARVPSMGSRRAEHQLEHAALLRGEADLGEPDRGDDESHAGPDQRPDEAAANPVANA
jgi:hypothetical protein